MYLKGDFEKFLEERREYCAPGREAVKERRSENQFVKLLHDIYDIISRREGGSGVAAGLTTSSAGNMNSPRNDLANDPRNGESFSLGRGEGDRK